MKRRLRAVFGLLLTAVMACSGIGFASAASFHDSGMRGSRNERRTNASTASAKSRRINK